METFSTSNIITIVLAIIGQVFMYGQYVSITKNLQSLVVELKETLKNQGEDIVNIKITLAELKTNRFKTKPNQT